MKIRHRTPSIFNLSMVDVLCCALGCVILLWLLNLRDAKQKAALAGRADEEVLSLRTRLSGLGSELDETRAILAELRSRYATAQSQVSDAERDLSSTRRRLAGVEAEAKVTADQLRSTQGERETLAGRASRLEKELLALRGDRAAAEAALAARTRAATDLEKQLAGVLGRADELGKRLTVFELRTKELEQDVARGNAVIALRDRDLLRSRTELQMAKQGLDILQGEKRVLASEVERVRTAAENRFAGITLTGRRVVFLIDMSGSMKHLDLQTPAPGKWAAVSAAVTKVMRSLPDLEKFQVILFEEEVSFPLGRPGAWHDAERGSASQVLTALEKTRPEGHTNMFLGLEAAFALKAQGLDTIYLFSDGIPSRGPGLTTEQMRTLKENEQGELLGKYIRQKLQNDWNRAAGQGKVRINTIGFFFESPEVGAFLWALARENEGSFVGMSQP